jgi:hypothetical protein
MQERLRQLRTKNDPLWIELTSPDACHLRPVTGAIEAEDIVNLVDDEETLDDSDVSIKDVLAATHRKPISTQQGKRRVLTAENGGLLAAVDAENIEELPVEEGENEQEDVGRGKRRKTANRLYSLADFERHWDSEASDAE